MDTPFSRNPSRIKRATRPRGIFIQLSPGFRVESRERPDHEASSSRFLPESESNQESDPAAPIRYEIGLARRDWGSGRWARRRPQHQAQRCRDREFLRLPSSTLHETRRPRDRIR